jgi:hypothetical protein
MMTTRSTAGLVQQREELEEEEEEEEEEEKQGEWERSEQWL